jgi:UTP--glucose-1-phosphate uridylyltransferase
MIRKAIFPVGGLGTRFLPATKAIPKEMLAVVDKPLIHYAVEEALAAGIELFIFVTGRGKSAIEDHFDYSYELNETLRSRGKSFQITEANEMVLAPGQVAYTRQQEPLGLGHAVWCARHYIGDEPFAVLLADDLIHGSVPCLQQMIEEQAKDPGANYVAVTQVEASETQSYGILDVASEVGPVVTARGIVEKPLPSQAPSHVGVVGRYILQPGIFSFLDHHQKGRGGEIQLTDAIAHMLPHTPLKGIRYEGVRYDCGSKLGMLAANLSYALQREDLKEGVRQLLRHFMEQETNER